LLALVACGGDSTTGTPDAGPLVPTANLAREIVDTQLRVDVTALNGTVTITFGPSQMPGGSLEVGDLTIESVTSGDGELAFAVTGAQLDLALPPSAQPIAVDITYHFALHEKFDGVSANGFTFLWPYYCGNVFPCHSEPADGTTFTLDVAGVPTG